MQRGVERRRQSRVRVAVYDGVRDVMALRTPVGIVATSASKTMALPIGWECSYMYDALSVLDGIGIGGGVSVSRGMLGTVGEDGGSGRAQLTPVDVINNALDVGEERRGLQIFLGRFFLFRQVNLSARD